MPDTDPNLQLSRLTQALDELAGVQLELDRERLARQQIESSFDQTLRSMSDAVLLVDTTGAVTHANPAAARLLGRPAQGLVGLTVASLLGAQVPDTPWRLLDAHPAGQVQLEAAVIVPGGAGAPRPVSVSCALLRDPGDKIVGGIYAARDLTETQRLVHQLEAAESRWRLLAVTGELLEDLVTADAALPAIVALLADRLSAEAAFVLCADSVVDTVVAHGPSAALMEALQGLPVPAGTALAAAVEDGVPVHATTVGPDYPLLAAPGDASGPSPGSAVIVPVRGRKTVLGVLAVLHEQTGVLGDDAVQLAGQVADRVGLALANARLRDDLVQLQAGQRAAQARQDLIAGLSHDMKTPLTVIEGLVGHLRRTPGQNPPTVLDTLARQTRRLRRLIFQFLDYSRLEAGHDLAVVISPVWLAELIPAVIHTAEQRDRITVDVPADLPAVLADPDRLDQVLANLVSNAVKFSPPDTDVTVRARATGATVEVTVQDAGPGIALEDQAHLFDKFRRGANAEAVEGTGLGLYLARALVQAMGGHISAASGSGRGTAMTVALRAGGAAPA